MLIQQRLFISISSKSVDEIANIATFSHASFNGNGFSSYERLSTFIKFELTSDWIGFNRKFPSNAYTLQLSHPGYANFKSNLIDSIQFNFILVLNSDCSTLISGMRKAQLRHGIATAKHLWRLQAGKIIAYTRWGKAHLSRAKISTEWKKTQKIVSKI